LELDDLDSFSASFETFFSSLVAGIAGAGLESRKVVGELEEVGWKGLWGDLCSFFTAAVEAADDVLENAGVLHLESAGTNEETEVAMSAMATKKRRRIWHIIVRQY